MIQAPQKADPVGDSVLAAPLPCPPAHGAVAVLRPPEQGVEPAAVADAAERDLPRAPPGCVHQWFEARAQEQPDAIALVCEQTRLTYRELDDRANQLAHYLRRQGVGPEVLVGLCLDRTVELVVGILGILKAGGAYVPLDLAYPQERRAFMLADARVAVLVTQQAWADGLADPTRRVVCLDREAAEIAREPTSRPASGVSPANLAYVIYTSGSTGKPKGALITHANVARLFSATAPWFGFNRSDVWTLFHSCAFDFSVWELWGALAYGGRLVVVPFCVSRAPETFYRLLVEQGVTVLNQTPSAFRQLIRAEEAVGQHPALALRYVIFGGEALDLNTLRPWFARHGDQQPQLVNMYGITETTVHVTYRPLRARDLDRDRSAGGNGLPGHGSVIGVPLPDLQVYLLDERQQPVPMGQPGEIYVGGAGVGRGYLNRPELTAQRFLADPFSGQPGARLYRSGDLGRRLPDGELEYLGRVDQQVKIRGYRVELGEIEAALGEHPAVRESVVVARDDGTGEKQLVAYLIRRAGADLSLADLRRRLRQRLPEYMMPAAFVFIDRLPLTPNGKLDVQALPAPGAAPAEAHPRIAPPETELQRLIAACWQEVLRQPAVGLDDNFFDLGGNSIRLAEVHARLQRALARAFPITDLFAHPTVRALALHLGAGTVAAAGLSALQERARRQREATRARRPGA